jgi:hypothetical protein
MEARPRNADSEVEEQIGRHVDGAALSSARIFPVRKDRQRAV